ncbi:MAG TPA: NUDIX hydrolase [bacterium]
MEKERVKLHFSAGGIIYRNNNGLLEVALISRKSKKGRILWGIPKGMIEKGESVEETALREVREETGLSGELKGKLGEIDYWFYSKDDGGRVHKKVYFSLIEYKSGSTDDHDEEVDEARWVPLHEAIEILSYDSEKAIIKNAIEALKNKI